MKKILSLLFLFCSMWAFSAGHWTTLRLEDNQSPKNDIRSICFDKQGNMWVGTWYGIYKYENGQWQIKGLENGYVETLFIDNKDIKWVGLWGGGLCKCDDDKNWNKVKEASPYNSINVVSADRKGHIWVGDYGGGAVNLEPKGEVNSDNKTGGDAAAKEDKWVVYKADKVNLGDNSILSITADAKGRTWFGTYHGVSVLENSQWTLFNKQNSQLPDNDIYSLCSDLKGNVWIGTCNGVAKVSGSKWTVYKKENSGLVSNLILSLATDTKGNVWIGTNKGLSVFNGVKWTTYTVENGSLPDNRVQTITVYKNKVYVGTSSGISVWDESLVSSKNLR
ncbi:MAG: two-component regulator propeller domain-containing protein [Bacteroidota bacterium]|nr:two-component regulator propeller domain-containing protein [Bacteroidota bacterium]